MEYEKFVIDSIRKSWKLQVELFNCDRTYLETVRHVISIHASDHSVALFLMMKDQADLSLYCHPLLSFEGEKEYIIQYTQKFNYPLVILTRIADLDDLFIQNGVPTRIRRWCWRMFKIEPARLFYKTFMDSGIVEYLGIQAWQSPSRARMNPERRENLKSTKRYKVYQEFPVFHLSHADNLKILREYDIPLNPNTTEYNRHGCFLCPNAGKKYYKQLKEENPYLFFECERLMELGSIGREDRYYYYPKDRLI